MKIVIQRVNKASVAVKETGKIIGKIDKGLFILLGIKKEDTKERVDTLVEKISKMRIMADESNKMNLSVLDTKSEVLIVSQFTLYANTKDGNRPSFIDAEDPAKAKLLYDYMVNKLKETKLNIQTGSFGDYMEIETVLDGPVTIVLES